MAIARSGAGGAYTSSASSHTESITVSAGSNLVLFAGVLTNATNTDIVSGVTYNGVAMTRVRFFGGVSQSLYLYYLANPATGANDLVASFTQATGSALGGSAYSGANQSGVDSSAGGNDATTPGTVATTVVASNCWLVAMGALDGSGTSPAADTGGTPASAQVVSMNSGFDMFLDSNATVGTGSLALGMTWSGSDNYGGITASIAPASAAPPTFDAISLGANF